MADGLNTRETTQTKTCTRCKKALPATAEFYSAHPRGRFGLQSRCRPCLRAILREHYRTPKGKAAGAAWKKAHEAAFRAYQKDWQSKNKHLIAAAAKKRREVLGYREKVRSYNTGWVREKSRDPDWHARRIERIREWKNRPDVKERLKAERRAAI